MDKKLWNKIFRENKLTEGKASIVNTAAQLLSKINGTKRQPKSLELEFEVDGKKYTDVAVVETGSKLKFILTK